MLIFQKKKGVDNVFTFGVKEEVDFNVSDININKEGVNFKLNYRGKTVPFWVSGISKEEDVEVDSDEEEEEEEEDEEEVVYEYVDEEDVNSDDEIEYVDEEEDDE